MPAKDNLRARVARFKDQCDAVCEEARRMVLANRALMRILEHAKRPRRTARHADLRRGHSADVAGVFAKSSQELLDLVHSDIEVASTFAKMSQQVTDSARKHRLVRNAFVAYETALRLRAQIALPADKDYELDAKLQQLQSKLAALAIHFRASSRRTSDS